MDQTCTSQSVFKPPNEDQFEMDYLKKPPICFIITGKPGCGKSTLAKNLAAVWKCCLINDTSLLEEVISEGTDLGIKAKDILQSGDMLTEEFVAEVISSKLQSSSINNSGYVLDCLPSLCEEWKSIGEQLTFIKKLPTCPTIVINLKIPDQELERRRLHFKVNPTDEKLYICREASEAETLEESFEAEETTDSNDDDEEEDKNSEEEDDIFQEDMAKLDEDNSIIELNDEYIRRPRDMLKAVDGEIQYYNDVVLQPLEDMISHLSKDYVVELDACLPPQEIFKNLLVHLDNLGVTHSHVPLHLVDPEQDEDDGEGLDGDQLLQRLSDIGILLPKFRWRRTKWSRYCPVQLERGNLMQGRLEFSVGYLDKMYSLSSAEALKEFIRNPRPYLLPPLPKTPCKICVLGPPTSGKSTLAKQLAEHYDAMVLNIQQLLIPVIAKTKNQLIEEAQLQAASNFIASRGMTEDISEEEVLKHPDVVKAIETETAKINASSDPISQQMYMDALRNGIDLAEETRREKSPEGPRHGGWIVDSFPMTRDNWTAMIENSLLPDFVINIDDENAPEDFLLTRFKKIHNLPSTVDSAESSKSESQDESAAKVPELLTMWQSARSDYIRQWSHLSSAIKGSAIDPLNIDCTLSVEDMVSKAVTLMEGVFSCKPLEYSFMDDDADADDDPNLDSDIVDEDEEASESGSRQLKPWGDTRHFCPVALRNDNVLSPGNTEILLKHRERLYSFSTDDAKEKFLSDPLQYTAASKAFELPPVRIFLLGAKSAGKTTVGRYLAKKLKLFHISLRELLQEQVLPKMKKPPLIDQDEWEDNEPTPKETEDNSDEDPDLKMPLNEEETEIRSYLTNEGGLSEERMEQYLRPFWSEEPYKSTGFILEGFPSKPEELRHLAEIGCFPDAAVILQVEESHIVNRILPPRVKLWIKKRDERVAKRKQLIETTLKEWKEDKESRKATLKAEYESKLTAYSGSSDEDDETSKVDVYHEEYMEQLAEIDEEEPPDVEVEEEEESEADAIGRMKNTIIEQFEEQVDSLSNLQEVFSELQVPCHSVNGCRQPSVVKYSVEKCMRPYTTNRNGLLTKCTPINADIAKKLLDHGYKHLSPFKKWCPVKLMDEGYRILPPMNQLKAQQFPVIFGQYIYFLSSLSLRERFMETPLKYISQCPPGPAVPIMLSVLGPPKSGKTTVAKKFCSEYGCVRLSIGEVLRRIMEKFPQSKLAELIDSQLKSGQAVPEDLCMYALESALLDVDCKTRGFVLDGWPSTKAQVNLLNKFRIIPVCIVELGLNEAGVLKRGYKDRKSPDRMYPVHDSDSILLVRSKHYYDNIAAVKDWYVKEHDNWHTIDGGSSRWKVWNEANKRVMFTAKQIQQYLSKISPDQAKSINGLCITPSDFKSRLGEFSEYCPVNLALHDQLIDCSTTKSLKYAAEYRGKYYKMSTYEDMQTFLADPGSFVSPKAPHPLPPTTRLPVRKSDLDVKALFPKQFEINGFCAVCYVEGRKKYESLHPGNPESSAEYSSKLFCFCSNEHMEKFMRKPKLYEGLTLPSKLPPLKQALPVTSLPMLGYMEQTVSAAIIEALNALGNYKPKFPFYSSTKSALYYVGLHLKAYNPKSSKFVRQKYKKELVKFEEKCKFIEYLSQHMKEGYKDPQKRPIQFDQQMKYFMDLQIAN